MLQFNYYLYMEQVLFIEYYRIEITVYVHISLTDRYLFLITNTKIRRVDWYLYKEQINRFLKTLIYKLKVIIEFIMFVFKNFDDQINYNF